MGKVSESIWSNAGVVIPMAEVSHIDKYPDTQIHSHRIFIYFKHSKANPENEGELEPYSYLHEKTGSVGFIRDWCTYRAELESETIADPPSDGEKMESMTDYILNIDWMTTTEFCKTYDVPLPTVSDGVNGFLQVDAIKHKMFVEHAKKLRRAKQE